MIKRQQQHKITTTNATKVESFLYFTKRSVIKLTQKNTPSEITVASSVNYILIINQLPPQRTNA
jgi:hypothetical protein